MNTHGTPYDLSKEQNATETLKNCVYINLDDCSIYFVKINFV